MLGKIFLLIELVMRLFKLWDQFADYTEESRKAEVEKRRQDRAKAIEDSKKAESDDDIWKSQEDIVKHRPRP
jgi:hypothetical protein